MWSSTLLGHEGRGNSTEKEDGWRRYHFLDSEEVAYGPTEVIC